MKSFVTLVSLCCVLLFGASPLLAAEVNVTFAASLKEVIAELSDKFAKSNPSTRILQNSGGSGALAKQVENGAPADIFISANLEWMEYLEKRNLVDRQTVTTLARNTLVFAGNPAKRVTGMKDLPKLERIAIGSPKSVPAGEYAMDALKRAGVEGSVQAKLVMAKDVRAALLYAERGEVDGAFVYHTDALQARQAKVLFAVPQELYPPVVYPMALTLAGAKNREAVAFFNYLKGKEARDVMSKRGFSVK